MCWRQKGCKHYLHVYWKDDEPKELWGKLGAGGQYTEFTLEMGKRNVMKGKSAKEVQIMQRKPNGAYRERFEQCVRMKTEDI